MENERKRKAIEIQNTNMSTSNVLPELDNDCLLYIFSFLPIIDRIRIQRVCKRWWEIGNLPWQDMKRLDFCWSTWTTRNHEFRLSEKILRQVFRLCGGFLREINISLRLDVKFGAITKNLEGVFVDLLKESCPNIQILNLQHVKTRCKMLEDFATYFNRINHFSLESEWRVEFSDENTLACFFQRNGNLRSVILRSVNLQGRCFRYLPFQIIEEININECSINEIELDDVPKQLYNLKAFTFTDSYCENFNDVFKLITAQSNLRKLEISLFPDNNLILTISTELHQLETLKLVGNILSADLLMSVSKNYRNLIKVTLIRSDNVTDKSLIQVLSLPNLQYVKLLYMFSITDSGLVVKMPKLKLLKCVACPLLQNNGFRAVMESSKNLEILWVYSCEKVSTAKLITDAVQITKNRKSNVTLKLWLGNEVCQVTNDSPWLQIVEF